MRILIVSQYFWPENFRINDLAEELVRRGHEVTVLTGQPNYPGGTIFDAFRAEPAAFACYKGVRIVRVPLVPRGSGSVRLLLNYLSFAVSACTIGLWKLRNVDFDVIFSPQLSPVTAMLPAVLLRKRRRRPFLMWVLDLWPDTLEALGTVKSRRSLALIGRLVGFIYHRCDHIFVQSQGFVPNVLKYTRRPVAVEFLPNWSEEMPEMGQITPAPEVKVRQGSFSVMFAGNIGESQDFPTILDAADRLRDVSGLRWLIVGDGRMIAWVESEVARRGLSNVELLGRFPVERMPSFYKHADAMLVSLKAEPIFAMTIPGKIQSYLAAGKPVLAMLDGEGADVVRKSGAGIACPSGDARALSAAVVRMMAMTSKERGALGQAALAYSKTEFDRDRLISRIEARLQTAVTPAV